VTELRDQL